MEAKRRIWTQSIAVAVVAAAFLLLAATAAARLSAESGSATIAPQQNGTATASCARGSEAVAGGFAAPGLDPTAETGPAILTHASKRPGHGKWRASGHNFHRNAPAPKRGEPGSGPVVAYAYCDKHDPGVTVKSKSTTVSPGAHAGLTPKCGRASEAVSGGFQSDAPDNAPDSDGLTAYAYTSKRAGERGWKVAVQNPDSASHKVTAFAYCEKHGPDLTARKASVEMNAMGTKTVAAKCPKGASVFSGGYASTFEGSSNSSKFALAYASKRATGNKWKVSAIHVVVNATASGTTETAFVYCAA
jgi:hypothetical protein